METTSKSFKKVEDAIRNYHCRLGNEAVCGIAVLIDSRHLEIRTGESSLSVADLEMLSSDISIPPDELLWWVTEKIKNTEDYLKVSKWIEQLYV